MSVKSEEEMNEMAIIKTHKDLFCRRCEVYDCGIHGILDVIFIAKRIILRLINA